jgi:hypothetical protein
VRKYENVCVAVESEAGSMGMPIVPSWAKAVRKLQEFGVSYLSEVVRNVLFKDVLIEVACCTGRTPIGS